MRNGRSDSAKATLFLALALVLAALPANASAAGEEAGEGRGSQQLEQVVVTATMTEKTIGEVPGSVEVITAEELAEMNADSVADALETATGLVVTTESGRVSAPDIRGTKSKHALILIDGRRLAAGFGELVDINQIPVLMVERIEIVRGPSSSLYGSDAIGGVVNIITRKPPKEGKVGARVQYGRDRNEEGTEYIGSVLAGDTFERLGVIAAGELRKKDGWDLVVNEQDDGDKEGEKSGIGRFALGFTDDHVLSGGFEFNEMSRQGLRYLENMTRDRDADDKRTGLFLQSDSKIGEKYRFMLRLNRSDYESNITITPATDNSAEGGYKQYLNQAEARFTGLFLERHLLTAGVDFREEGRNNVSTDDMDVDNFSVYLQDEYQILDPLLLVLGVRFDDHSEFGSQWTPKASLVYAVNANFRVKGGYGRGFRAPSITELSVTSWKKKGKLIYEPNPDLDPEKSESYEAGIEGNYGSFRGSATAFRNEVKNMIDAVYERTVGTGNNAKDYYRYQNIADARMQGIELEGRVRMPLGFSLAGNFSWLDTEDMDTGEELEGQPDCKGDLKLGYDHPGLKFHFNVRGSYLGRKHYETGDEGGYALFHCYLSKGLGDCFKVYAGINNIGDKAEQEPTFYYAGMSVDL